VRIERVSAPIPLLNGISPPGNSFVVPDLKIVYMSVTKAACTSLRWMIADLAGEDLEQFYTALGAQQTRLMTIHGTRERWQHTPQLGQLSPEQLAEISTDNGWFVFAVVRDPWSRIWSAWQSKFLVRHPFYEGYQDEPWYPAVPTSQEGIIKDFRAFLDVRPWTWDPQLSTDVHFLPQVVSVRPQGVNYSRVYDLADLGALFDDLRAHLASVGRPDQELYVPRANETPLPLIPPVLADGVAEVIEELYADDFAAFGDRWDRESMLRGDASWSDDAIAHAAYHTRANERIGDLSKQARELRRKFRRAAGLNQSLRGELDRLHGAAARRPVARVRRRAGRLRRELGERLRARRDQR
jgi:Sulfotransferase family